ncbi:uncharacterized protein LOC123006560 [Tribolium madens]|uniref:uncharacterized protein LOC123006560 n=1 Tax=Tribolium madens TaxID=41895 RepID=UPI001CF73912|nr:uncharacterized protein LOC123006560 [Tribolium madens]
MIFSAGSMASRVSRSALLMGCGALGYYFYKKYTNQENSAGGNASTSNNDFSCSNVAPQDNLELTADLESELYATDTDLELSTTASEESIDLIMPLPERQEIPLIDGVDIEGVGDEEIDYIIPPNFWDDLECDYSFDYGDDFYESTPQRSRATSDSDTIVLYFHPLNEDGTIRIEKE